MYQIYFSEFVNYMPAEALIKSATVKEYRIANIYIGNPIITVTIDLTNFNDTPPNYTGYIKYHITIDVGITVDAMIIYNGNVKTLDPIANVTFEEGKIVIKDDFDILYSIDVNDNTGFKVIMYRPERRLMLASAPFLTPSNNTLVRVPIIDISGQTSIDGEYLSDMTFIIKDKYKYKCHKNIVDDCGSGCVQHEYLYGRLKTTTIRTYNIPLQEVVIGKCGTLREKVIIIILLDMINFILNVIKIVKLYYYNINRYYKFI